MVDMNLISSLFPSLSLSLSLSSLTSHSSRESSPVGKDEEWEVFSVHVFHRLSCFEGGVRIPHLASLANYLYKKRKGESHHLQCTVQQVVLTVLSESGLAGSAGWVHSTERVSTVMTPQGIPPSLVRPHTTVIAQLSRLSMKLPRSKKPYSHSWPPGA